jgi:hypothetical protein
VNQAFQDNAQCAAVLQDQEYGHDAPGDVAMQYFMSGAQHQNCRAGNFQAFIIAAKRVQLEKSSPMVTGNNGNDKTYQEMTVAPAVNPQA